VTILDPVLVGGMLATTAAYWSLPRVGRRPLLVLVALTLLGAVSPTGALAAGFLTVASFGLGRRSRSGAGVILAVGLIVVFWLTFKLPASPVGGGDASRVLVPLGLTYGVARSIHYVVESYEGTLPPHGFWDYAAYMLFPPTIIAGPIHRFPEFARDLRRQRWDPERASAGSHRIVHGFAQIAILGNTLVSHELAQRIAPLRDPHPALYAYLDCVRYGLNLYFQFAGYSSVAVGFALVLGFRVMENFDAPLVRSNIAGFWQSWHISLSSWCRDYVYFPIAAWRRSHALAVLSGMAVLGIWHEPSGRYLAWGLLHGAALLVWRWSSTRPSAGRFGRGRLRGLTRGLSTLLTVGFVMLSFALTKAPDLETGLGTLRTILLGWR